MISWLRGWLQWLAYRAYHEREMLPLSFSAWRQSAHKFCADYCRTENIPDGAR